MSFHGLIVHSFLALNNISLYIPQFIYPFTLVNDFNAFLCIGRCKNLGSLKSSLDMHLNYLGPVYPKHRILPVFLHPEFPSEHTVGGQLQWLMT